MARSFVAAKAILEDWLASHFEDPYPDEEEKARLVQLTGITLRQINNWFSNTRVRLWRPCIDSITDQAKTGRPARAPSGAT